MGVFHKSTGTGGSGVGSDRLKNCLQSAGFKFRQRFKPNLQPADTLGGKQNQMSKHRRQDPTPAEITSACLEIQAGWSADETMRRLRVDLRPQVRCADSRLVPVSANDYDTHTHRGELQRC